jgi:CDP-diacylglycerol---glycerol-3-phosphate 3-phosphatidyltransferase
MKQIFLKPNSITLMRILLIPIFAWFFIIDFPYNNLIAALLFLILSLSDFLDGYIARKTGQTTKLGKILDPIADKLLISVALILLADKVPLWMVAAIIAREWIITILRFIVMPKHIVPADRFGKTKTVIQIAAIIAVMVNFPFGWHLMLLAVIATLSSGLVYIVNISDMMDEKILNIPNLITFMRLSLLPLFAILMINSKMNYALLIFAIIAISDKVDGISSRVMKQTTEFGRSFDSFTDWTVFVVTFILLVSLNYIELILVLLLVIPVVVIFFVKLTFLKKKKQAPVTPIARVSAALVYLAIISILIGFIYTNQILILAFVTLYLSMVRYLILVIKLNKSVSH